MNASPARVVGSGFHAQERVVVTVSSGSTHLSKAVVASARGVIVAHFVKAVAVDRCGHILVVAVGSTGDRAAWKSAPQSCGTPQQPVTQ